MRRLLLLVGGLLLTVSGFGVANAAPPSDPGPPQMVTICHAAGLEGTTQYVTLTIPYVAAFGPAGHFNENGTPRAGHEDDYLGECEGDDTTTTTEETTTTTEETTTTTEETTTTVGSTIPVITTRDTISTTTAVETTAVETTVAETTTSTPSESTTTAVASQTSAPPPPPPSVGTKSLPSTGAAQTIGWSMTAAGLIMLGWYLVALSRRNSAAL